MVQRGQNYLTTRAPVSVKDPVFSEERDTNPKGRGVNLLFNQIVMGNCMKMKEIGSRGRPWHPFDPTMGIVVFTLLELVTRLSVKIEIWWI